jgi:CHAT domain-containing protein
VAQAHDDAALRAHVLRSGPASLETAESLHDLANLYRLDRRTDEAYTFFEGAYDIRRARLGPVDDDVAGTLGGMAFLRASQGRWDDVARLARAALDATPAGPGIPTSTRGLRLALLGQALERLGHAREAAGALAEAAALRESLWARTGRDESSTIVAGLGIYRDLAIALAEDGHGEAAFEQLARGSSRTLTRRLLATDSAAADPWHGVLPRVQAALADDEAMIAWVRSPLTDYSGAEPLWACVVRPHRAIRWFPLARDAGPRARDAGPRARFSTRDALWLELRATSQWPRRVEDASTVDRMADRMWREWFAPLEPELAGVRRIVVCAPDLVAGGPLGALRDDRGRWLGDRFVISYTPSALLFAHERERAAATRRTNAGAALLVGDPAYAANDPGRWPRLEGSGEEMRAIAARWPAATLLTGAQARASALRALAAQGALARYRVLHFAAHTAIDTRHALDAALVLAPDAPDGVASRLLAREVAANWRLDADLVCLAGCQTTLGLPSASDGWFGLQEAFLAAGAHSLLVTCWPVDDRATAMLMQSFYARLADSASDGDCARALREAQAELRAYATPDGRHPYAHPGYWAPFVLVGSARPVAAKRS